MNTIESGENGHFEECGHENSAMAETIVKAAVKDELSDVNVSADFYDALDEKVTDLLEDASRRADENDRKTVQPRDL